MAQVGVDRARKYKYNIYIVPTLRTIAGLPEGPERFASIAAWVQGLYPKGVAPALVGGGAVSLHTDGAYVTSDLDFVGVVPQEVALELTNAGFHRKGRYWVHEEFEIFLEFPAAALDPGATTEVIERAGQQVIVLGLEELMVDRLCAWQFWQSEIDAVNALLLWRARGERIDLRRLNQLAIAAQVAEPLESLQRFHARFDNKEPDTASLRSWARREE